MPVTVILGRRGPLATWLSVALCLHPDMVLFHHNADVYRQWLKAFFECRICLQDLINKICKASIRDAPVLTGLLGSDTNVDVVTEAKQRSVAPGTEAHGVLNDPDIVGHLLQHVDTQRFIAANPEINFVTCLEPGCDVDTLVWALDLEARFPRKVMHMIPHRVTTADIKRYEKQAALPKDPTFRQQLQQLLTQAPPASMDDDFALRASQRLQHDTTDVAHLVLTQMLQHCGILGSSVKLYPLPTCTVQY